jgi:N-acetylglucosamine-6-phosphate deacetylase
MLLPGTHADLVILDRSDNALGTWVKGKERSFLYGNEKNGKR